MPDGEGYALRYKLQSEYREGHGMMGVAIVDELAASLPQREVTP
jgi:hypothetical protein